MYKEQIGTIIGKLSTENDQDSVQLVDEMLKNCMAYVQKVYALEVYILTKTEGDPDEYRQTVSNMDHTRSVTHNALISSVKIVNRIFDRAGLPPIFTGDTEKRIEVANFAMEIVSELFSLRRL